MLFFYRGAGGSQERFIGGEHYLVTRGGKRGESEPPFYHDAMVVLPDHIHALWTLPQGENNYSMRWMLIKRHISMSLPKTENIKTTRLYKRERGIWQRRFWEHTIRDERDFYKHIEYIHYNLVKHGYVSNAKDWPYSSIHLFA